ncbi:MAG: hypothetical protein GF398_18315 [Chitinivibrionales bacterium]|nr:hypothetical protein [Chitinivibrionales bacterium]
MKKSLAVILIICAIPIYIWDAFLIFRTASTNQTQLPPDSTSRQSFTIDMALASAEIVTFDIKGKDPFSPHKAKPRPRPKPKPEKKSAKPRITKKPTKQPDITISGIMWNAANPVAILVLPNGGSTMVKAGQTVAGGILVKKIEQKSVVVEVEGTEFVLR